VQIVTRSSLSRLAGIAALAAVVGGSAGCGELARTGDSPAFLIIESLTAASGADPSTFGNPLSSDVETIVNGNPTIFSDLGRAVLRIGLKDPGSVAAPTAPSTINSVTINRYRVEFRRADGRNTPGVDVPFAFDGAVTGTIIGAQSLTLNFQMVSHAAKLEPPLRGLRGGGGQMFIHTLAEVTFYGRDQAGNEVQVSGLISVNFGDFADP
jgi:hypothetical protein